MPNKSLTYYWNTLLLKTAAHTCGMADRVHLLDGYKFQNKEIYSALYDQQFQHGMVQGNARFSHLHITYCHFDYPIELGKHLLFNNNGIAMCRKDIKVPFHNPFFSAYYALVCYNHYWRRNDLQSLAAFWEHVHFLEKSGLENGDCLMFYYNFNYPKFGLKSPWISGLTQAAITSVFIRAAKLGQAEKYESLAKMTCNSLFIPVEQGGVLRMLKDDGLWIEEYPSFEPDLTLNGFVLCLVALYEYYHISNPDPIFNGRLQSLVKSFFYVLHKFIYGKYTRYHKRSGIFHNIEYQGFYVCLFLHLWKLSDKPAFLELALHFNKYISWEDFYRFYEIKDQSKELVLPFFQDKGYERTKD